MNTRVRFASIAIAVVILGSIFAAPAYAATPAPGGDCGTSSGWQGTAAMADVWAGGGISNASYKITVELWRQDKNALTQQWGTPYRLFTNTQSGSNTIKFTVYTGQQYIAPWDHPNIIVKAWMEVYYNGRYVFGPGAYCTGSKVW